MVLRPLKIQLWIQKKARQRSENMKEVGEQKKQGLKNLENPLIVLRY